MNRLSNLVVSAESIGNLERRLEKHFDMDEGNKCAYIILGPPSGGSTFMCLLLLSSYVLKINGNKVNNKLDMENAYKKSQRANKENGAERRFYGERKAELIVMK